MPDVADMRRLEAVLRSLATAARSLRLYPAASPIPLQSVQAVRDALERVLRDRPRPAGASRSPATGFSVDGAPLGAQIPGARDLSDELRAHGIAEIELCCRRIRRGAAGLPHDHRPARRRGARRRWRRSARRRRWRSTTSASPRCGSPSSTGAATRMRRRGLPARPRRGSRRSCGLVRRRCRR